MDNLKLIDRLVMMARGETIPEVDVSAQVMLTIRSGEIVEDSFGVTPLTIFTAMSAVAASIILFLAINAWVTMSDPMAEFFGPIQVASLW